MPDLWVIERITGRLPCKQGGSRAIVITPDKNAFYCHAAKKGGDVISLVAHIHGCGMKEAASWLQEKSTKKKATPPKKEAKVDNDFQPLSHLVFEHDLVQALGITSDDASTLGIGYASRGLMKGYICIPVRDETGFLNGYVGIREGKTPKQWHYPPSNVVPITKKRA